ncbi:Transposase, partial [Caligus rogercresseyi]
ETGKTSDRPRSSRPMSVRTQVCVKRIREKIRRNLARSLRKMAKEENMSEGSMRNLVKKDLGMTPYKKIRLQLLSEATIEKRRERGRILLNKLKSGTQGPVFFTDEKLFTVQAVYNSQNDRILAKSSADILVKVRGVFRRQNPKSVMVWEGVMSDGKKSPLIFVPEGVKINKEVYLSMLNDQVLPWIKAEYGETFFTFQQDSAPARVCKKPKILKKPGFY